MLATVMQFNISTMSKKGDMNTHTHALMIGIDFDFDNRNVRVVMIFRIINMESNILT